ncbi:uncharacterized protein LOC8284759 isoform X2 [Ricinus communis]|uniref:uncharacterized protein LOC8284759 isoform X2 n=1 Tax=Ricinus communis TaxID=3988 RepID=UPI00201B0B63|nr:uncharacterized protein LOC8284759 isoform X2 [Ricinus communis]
MANPSGVHHQQEGNHASSSFNGGNIPTNGHGNSGPETSGTNLKHNPGISTDWTLEEQAILEDALNQYAAESSVIRYAKIAVQLQNKTVRDVALRCRWMTKKEYSKRRKEDSLARKSKDKKERVTDPSVKASRFMARSNVHPYATSMIPMEYDDGMAYNVCCMQALMELQGSFLIKMQRPWITYLLISPLCSYRRTSVSSARLVTTF